MVFRMPLTAFRRRRRRRIAAKLIVDYGPTFFDRHEFKRSVTGPVADLRRCNCPGNVDLTVPQCAAEAEPGSLYCRACRDFCPAYDPDLDA